MNKSEQWVKANVKDIEKSMEDAVKQTLNEPSPTSRPVVKLPLLGERGQMPFDHLKELHKGEFEFMIANRSGRRFEDGQLSVNGKLHYFRWHHQYDEGDNYVVYDGKMPKFYFLAEHEPEDPSRIGVADLEAVENEGA